jgi:hypothetical protein
VLLVELALATAGAGCMKARPVEAPVVDIVTSAVDASAPAWATAPAGSHVRREDDPAWVGRWEGIGRQDAQTTWPMVVELRATTPGVCATVSYPSIPCRAEWICSESAPDARVREATEHLLDDGSSRCIDDGTMVMRLEADGSLQWLWRGSGEIASATLRRAR